MKNTHLAIGIASSMAVGAIIGILFAPDKGLNTRNRIIQRGNGLKKDVEETVDNMAPSRENKDK